MRNFSVDPNVYIIFAALCFLIPLPWLISWSVAVCFHEFCHLAAVKVNGGSVRSFTLRLSGANIESVDLSDNGYLLSVLAGPIGGLALVSLGRWLPRIAICSWVLSVYNLLPVLPLDGGQAIRILLKNDSLLYVLQNIVLIIISVLAIYLCFYLRIGPLPLVTAISLWVKNRKRPCKETLCGVQ